MPEVTNPYYPGKLDQLSALLMSMGQGITASDMAGRGVLPGLGLGAGIYGAAQAQAMQHAQDWQQQQEARAFRDRQIGLQEAELADKRGERDRLRMGANAWAAANGGIPGMAPPQAGPTMGPGPDLLKAGAPKVEYLQSKYGLSPVAAAGVVGNLYQESRFNPTETHDGGRGYGMAGWDPNRTAALQAFAQSQGKPASDPQVQLDFVVNEGKSGDMGAQRAWSMLQTAKTPEEATTALMHYFRPAGYTPANPTAGHGYAQRVQYTQTLLPGGVPTAAAPSPSPAPAPAPGVAPPTAAPGLPTLEEPPRPTQLPPELARYLSQQVISGGMTVPQAEAEKQRILGEMWSAQRQSAQTRYQQQVELYKHQRGLDTDGEWVRGADGVERFVPKSQRPAGMQRFDKPKDAGTETGDVEILGKADPSSREYAAAYNRLSQKWHDIGGGQKIRADMTAYARPTFVEPNAAAPPKAEGERSYTETQNKDHTYATRLDMAIPEFVKLLKDDKGHFSMANVPSNSQWVAANSAYYPESQVSPKVKEFRRLAADISTALLRRESGASIGKHEFTTEDYKFIPLAGDTPEIVAKKMAALHNAARTFAEGTGRDKYSYKNLWPSDGAAASSPPPSAPIKIDMGGNRR